MRKLKGKVLIKESDEEGRIGRMRGVWKEGDETRRMRCKKEGGAQLTQNRIDVEREKQNQFV
jgi:hypothetical protein